VKLFKCVIAVLVEKVRLLGTELEYLKILVTLHLIVDSLSRSRDCDN
jgi:hypothetical protein